MNSFSHDFEAAVKLIHDNLYASSNIRTPEELQDEFTKVFLSCQQLLRSGGFKFSLTAPNDDDAEFSQIEESFSAYKKEHSDYQSNIQIELDPKSSVMVARSLLTFDLLSTDRDWLGDALEVFRSTAAKRLGGQFFTDQRVTDFAINLLGFEPSKHVFVDTCAGTGGFLIAASKKISTSKTAKEKGIFGIEIDPKLSHLANATLKHLRPNQTPKVYNADSLHDRGWTSETSSKVNEKVVDMIASNPPFGIKITIKDPKIIDSYDLSRIWTSQEDGWERTSRVTFRAPDILFLERNLKLVKPGTGRIALVLPYQILSGPRTGYVREWLLRHARLLAVVDLPDDTFQPWTGTKTALVMAERREVPLEKWEPEDYPIFMAVSEHIGHDRRGKPVLDENGAIYTDLPDIQETYQDWLASGRLENPSSKGFVISASEIGKENDLRINASFFNPKASQLRDEFVIGKSTNNYEVRRFGDLVEAIVCPGRFKRKYVDTHVEGIPFLGGSNIVQFSVQTKKFLAKDDPHLSDLIVKAGWLLVTRSGSTGIVSSVPKTWDGVAMSDHVIRIVPKENSEIPIEYLEAYLRSELGQKLISAEVFGSVIDEITPGQIAALPVPIPKNEATLASIVSTQKKANSGREAAANSTVRAVEEIDSFHESF